MAVVVKVEFEGILRRLLLKVEGTESISFAKLEEKVRDLFKLPEDAALRVTYKDKEEDVVLLTSDEELKDACTIQKLNPLRLKVAILPRKMNEKDSSEAVDASDENLKKVAAQFSDVSVTESKESNESNQPPSAEKKMTPADWLKSIPAPGKKPDQVGDQKEEAKKETATENPTKQAVVHAGVTCDMCNANPITGIRYKSIKKVNYDLCGRCFDKSGRNDEYTSIEQPLLRPGWRMVRQCPAFAAKPGCTYGVQKKEIACGNRERK